MAFIDPTRTSYAIIKETTAGVTPATPAFLGLDYIPGSMPNLTSDVVSSTLLKPSRSSAGTRKTNYRTGGDLKTELKRDASIDALLESGLSGAFATGVLKGSFVDSSLTVECKMSDGANPFYARYVGTYVNKIDLSCDAANVSQLSFGLIGMDRTTATTAITGATYGAASSNLPLSGLDVSNVTVAGLTAVYRSLQLTVEQTRESKDQFGVASSAGIGTYNPRKSTLQLVFYRSDLSPDTLLAKSDTPVAVSFQIGGVGTGYQVQFPAANYDIPTDSVSNSSALVTINFTASNDSVSGTDVIITKL